MNYIYPFLFKQNLKTLVWGTEDWTVSGVPGSESVVDNGECAGMTLSEVISHAPVDILGKQVYDKYGAKLPLLAKVIDAHKDLSIQVHPNDEMALREHNKMGKSEMWYVMDAREGAYLYAGFNRKITPEEYKQRVDDGTITEVLARHEVHKGDVFYLPAGRVHAICGGIKIAEIQQSSDVTYRIFDYNRPGIDGKPRELHTELASRAIDYHVEDEYRTIYDNDVNRANRVIECPFFNIRVAEIDKMFHRNLVKYDSFIISMCLRGTFRIKVRSTGDEIVVREGQSCLLPASIADYDVTPVYANSLILDAFIDNKDRSLTSMLTRFFHITQK